MRYEYNHTIKAFRGSHTASERYVMHDCLAPSTVFLTKRSRSFCHYIRQTYICISTKYLPTQPSLLNCPTTYTLIFRSILENYMVNFVASLNWLSRQIKQLNNPLPLKFPLLFLNNLLLHLVIF